MKTLASLLIKGLSAILPVAVALFFIYWVGATAEHALGKALQALLPENIYLPGMGVLAGLILAIGVGLLLNLWLFQRLVAFVEGLLARLPLIKTLLSSIKDLMAFLAKAKKNTGQQAVVQIDLGNDIRLLGIMTRHDLSRTGLATMGEERCAVYVPMSYQLGGYTLYLPRSRLTPLNMSVEDALRFAMTAGMALEGKLKDLPPPACPQCYPPATLPGPQSLPACNAVHSTAGRRASVAGGCVALPARSRCAPSAAGGRAGSVAGEAVPGAAI